jgi:hypothetical protein
MPRQFKICALLDKKHWLPFHTMLADRRTTVDVAHDWTSRRGYRISRSAIGKYFQLFRSGSIRIPAFHVAAQGVGGARRQLHAWIDRLSDIQIVGLATFAGFVLTRASAKVAFGRVSKRVRMVV